MQLCRPASTDCVTMRRWHSFSITKRTYPKKKAGFRIELKSKLLYRSPIGFEVQRPAPADSPGQPIKRLYAILMDDSCY